MNQQISTLLALALLVGCVPSDDTAVDDAPVGGDKRVAAAELIDGYIDRYLETFPSRATAAGLYAHDGRLENLDSTTLESWAAFNHAAADRAEVLSATLATIDDRLDLELLARQARRTVFAYEVEQRPQHDPLYWTGILGNATVFQLVRDDRPLGERLSLAAARAAHVPRLTQQAAAALRDGDPTRHAPALFSMAARQARATATFYRDGFARAAAPLNDAEIAARLASAGAEAATSLESLATSLDDLGALATGSPRLGDRYAERFRLVTGVQDPVDAVLARAEAALVAKRKEAADFGRSIWRETFGDRPMPSETEPDGDAALLRALFTRIGEDRAESVEAFIDDYRTLLSDSIQFVREHGIVTLPEPLTVYVSRSPDFFVGQGVGGVYPAGPFAPEADTLFYLPTPPSDASPEARDALFRDFNHHFNVMITPHEMVPGHYLQLKYAARHPRRVRALFGDGVFIEGWGTFCERLMLDLGWGGPLDRVAHLKKQLENIARTIVDIRVHTTGITHDEVLAFVRDEALQDAHFAGNMWTRAITSSPQLTSYFLGYEEVTGLYDAARVAAGDDFVLRDFTDGIMAIGPVPVARLAERLIDHDRR